ncbi:MAG: PIN domain-containing protein [Spirochaetaceae bacterium]|jgi:predicted nucleic acid-binding protein|nr:PIN domain-containing protein [Spirochaetaceae bacterium]
MPKTKLFLDSNAIILDLNKQVDLLSFLSQWPEREVYINHVVEMESLAKPGMSKEEEDTAWGLLSGFTRKQFTNKMRDIAVLIRREKKLLLPDAMIAASAICLSAIVISNDPHLLDFTFPGYSVRSIPAA